MKITTAALAVALVASTAMTLVPATPADAQALDSLRNRQRNRQQQQQEQAQPGQPQVGELSREENPAIAPLYTAVTASDWAAAQAALPAAQAGARTPYGRYVVGQLQLALGVGINNTEMQYQAVDAMVASGAAPADLLPRLLANQFDRMIAARNFAGAEPIAARLTELAPNDPANIERQAQIKSQLGDHGGALTLYRQAATMRSQAGQQVPEDSYRRMLATAYQLRQVQPSMELARDLLTHYPGTASNWRDSLTIYRELSNLDAPAQLDVYRLIRAAGALNGEADYINYAEAAERGAMFGEVKAVLDAGLGRNQITPGNTAYARQMLTSAEGRIAEDRASLAAERTRALAGANGTAALRLGDAYYGYGQFAEAAELYRAALQKGGVDANLVNTRLGAALAQAGQRAEAEAAFNAVQGPRQPLAQFWIMWLARQG